MKRTHHMLIQRVIWLVRSVNGCSEVPQWKAGRTASCTRGGRHNNRLSVELMTHFFIVSARGHSLCCTRMHTQKQKYWCAVDICMDQLVKRLENLIANIFYMNVG